MIKVKDGYAKLIGTTYKGSSSRVLLSNGGDHVIGNASGNIPLSNGTVSTNLNADLLDGLHASSFLRYYSANTDITNLNVVNTPSYLHTVSTTGNSPTTITKPSGMDNAWGVLHVHVHKGDHAMQLGFGGTTGNLYQRHAYSSSTFGSWKTILDSSNYSGILDSRYYTESEVNNKLAGYLPLSGGTMTGNIKVYTDGDGRGLKFGTSTLNSLSNQLLWQSAEAIRFGSSSWDWNAWAGLKYNHSSKIIYLGLADGTVFNANSGLSGGKLYLPGISDAYVGNGTYKILHLGNSSVSGGGNAGGSSITVNIGGTSKTLTIPTSLPANGGSANKLNSANLKSTSGLHYYYAGGITTSTDNTGNYVGPNSNTTYSSVLRLQSHATAGLLYYRDLIFDVNSNYIWSRRVTNSGTPSLVSILHSGNSSVSGGGSSWGSSITVKINDTTATLTIPSNPNTHWTTRIYAGASGTAANAAATNPYLKVTDNNTYRNLVRFVGGGATTVSSDASGNITISSTNTTYDLGISDYTVKIKGTTKNFVRDWGHGAANMNAVARGGRSSMGMADLSTPSGGTATAVNPNGGTSWHHFINIAYTDGGAGSNSWITQIANKAGTTDLWVRSRSGGTISDTANWTAGWTRILTGSNYSSVLDGRYYTESEVNNKLSGYLPLAGGTMNNGAIVKFNANGSIIQTTATTSNATAMILWYKGTAKDANYSHAAQIGWHNTGNTDGAIYLVPNPQNSEPWGGGVGLYIGKTLFKWNNNAIIHAGNYTTYTVKKDGTGASGTWGISITGNAATASNSSKLNSLSTIYNRLCYNLKSVTMSTTLTVWYIKIVLSAYALPCQFMIGGSYNNQIDRAIIETSGMSLGYIYRNCNQNGGNITGVWHKTNYDSSEKVWIFWIRLRGINNSSSHYAPSSSATYTVYMGESNGSFSVTATTTAPSGAEWTGVSNGITIKRADLVGNATTASYCANFGTSSAYVSYDLDTNNTTDTWVPVMKSGKLQHRVIPVAYNNAPSTLSVNYANSAGSATNADTVDGYHESSFLRYRDLGSNGGATLWSQIGIRSYHGALPEGLSGIYNYGGVVSFPGNGSRLDIFTNHVGSSESGGLGGLWWRSGWNNEKRPWRRIIDSGNIANLSVSYASSAGNADTVDNKHASDFATSGHNHDASYVKYAKVSKSTADSTNAKPYIYNIESETVISGYYGYWYILNLGLYSGGNFGTLLAMPYQDSLTDSELFIRSAKSGSWRTWRRVLHDGNYSGILDSRYYTETEADNRFVNATGDTMTGPLTFANGTWNVVGDDAAIGDYNAAGMLGLKSINNNIPGIGFHNKSNTLLGRLQANGSNLLWNDNKIWHAGNDGSGSGLDADLLDGYLASDLVFHKKYSSLSALPSGSTGWYRIGYIYDTDGSPSIFMVRAYAHSSAIFTVTKGYSTSGSITQLAYCSSVNGSYCCIQGARLLSDGAVEILLTKPSANNGTYVNIHISMYNANNKKLEGSLTLNSGSPTVIQSMSFINASMLATHFYESSDIKLKTNIQKILNSDKMPIIKEFDWKSDGTHSYGLIAQELEEMGYPELVSGEEDGHKTVKYSAALSLIVGKLQVKIRELEKEIENLKNKN